MLKMHKSVSVALRIAVAAACCVGIWSSLSFARADYLFQLDTDQSIRSAIHLVPDGWPYYMRLAQFDRPNARHLLESSLKLNPYNAQADIELGLQYEADGNLGEAEKHLLNAYSIDHTYLPRWSLANYYFRHDNMPAFWTWARSAAAMPAADIGSLFELCWRVSPNPAKISEAILNDNPEMLRQYVRFLLSRDQADAVGSVARLLIRSGDPESDRTFLFAVLNRLLVLDDAAAATMLWRQLIEQHWVVADTSVPNNASFQREPLPVSFDWNLPEYQGLHSWTGHAGLETEFSGSEPEDCIIAEQAVVLKPGNYVMVFHYHTSAIPPETGIRWQIFDPKTQKVIAESTDLSSDQVKKSQFNFSIPETSLSVLRLNYRRTLGTVRISGTLNTEATEIQALPN